MIFLRTPPWFVSVRWNCRFEEAISKKSVDLRKPIEVRNAGSPRKISVLVVSLRVDLRKPFEVCRAGGPATSFFFLVVSLQVDLRKP